MSSAFVKFNHFPLHLGQGEHLLEATGDILMLYLTNNTPDVDADVLKADLAGITEQFGYAAADAQNDYAESGGVGTLTCVNITFTGTGGSFGPFRYAVVYNSTATTLTNPLIAYWDYGSSITVNDEEVFNVNFPASVLTIGA